MVRLVRALVLLLLAAAVGFLVAREVRGHRSAAPDALGRRASAPTFTAHYPNDWRTVDPPALPGLTLADAVAVGPRASAGERFVVGTAHVATLGTLPAAFLRSLSARPRPQVVLLGGARVDRYLDLRPRGSAGVVSVYLLATTRGTVVGLCESPAPDGTFTAACERVLSALRLAAGVKILGGVDAGYALGINRILADLGRVRQAAAPGLVAKSLPQRASAARQLGGAEAAAASAATKLSPGGAAGANATLIAALREAASGYTELAVAADRRDATGYEAAQRTLQDAQQRLQSAFRTLSSLGYRLS